MKTLNYKIILKPIMSFVIIYFTFKPPLHFTSIIMKEKLLIFYHSDRMNGFSAIIFFIQTLLQNIVFDNIFVSTRISYRDEISFIFIVISHQLDKIASQSTRKLTYIFLKIFQYPGGSLAKFYKVKIILHKIQ